MQAYKRRCAEVCRHTRVGVQRCARVQRCAEPNRHAGIGVRRCAEVCIGTWSWPFATQHMFEYDLKGVGAREGRGGGRGEVG